MTYPRGSNPPGLSTDTNGRSWFRAKRLLADPAYNLLLEGDRLIVGARSVTFLDGSGVRRTVEPDILDLYWLSDVLDQATPPPT